MNELINNKAATLSALYEAERDRLSLLSDCGRTGDYSNPVFGEGPLEPVLMLIGEAPGREEAAAGKPFVGKAGKQLDSMLIKADICREQVFVTNAVKFRPTTVKTKSIANRTPVNDEVALSLPLLAEEIRLLNPRVIATLGNTPLRAVCTIFNVEQRAIGSVHGKTLMAGGGFLLFPLYHPASGIYNRALIDAMERDLIRLGECLKEV